MTEKIDFPFYDVAENAEKKIALGFDVYQKWTCEHCGARQTMPDTNHFYERGICEECKEETYIVPRGCNFMAVIATDMDEARRIITEAQEKKR